VMASRPAAIVPPGAGSNGAALPPVPDLVDVQPAATTAPSARNVRRLKVLTWSS